MVDRETPAVKFLAFRISCEQWFETKDRAWGFSAEGATITKGGWSLVDWPGLRQGRGGCRRRGTRYVPSEIAFTFTFKFGYWAWACVPRARPCSNGTDGRAVDVVLLSAEGSEGGATAVATVYAVTRSLLGSFVEVGLLLLLFVVVVGTLMCGWLLFGCSSSTTCEIFNALAGDD